MIRIRKLSYHELMNMYGDPERNAADVDEDLQLYSPPFLLKDLDGKPVQNLVMNSYIGSAVIDALYEIRNYYGSEYLSEHRLNVYGGCRVIRGTAGSDDETFWWSIHSWGMAVDFNPHLGPYGSPGRMPYHFVYAFLKRGFDWGGLWKKKRDEMHFSTGG